MPKYFKIVTWTDGSSRNFGPQDDMSSFSYVGGDYRIRYQVGRWVYPTLESSCLFVFDSLDAVRQFVCLGVFSPAGVAVFTCDIEPARLLTPRYLPDTARKLPSFWRAQQYSRLSEHISPMWTPDGTVLADAVRLRHFVCRADTLRCQHRYRTIQARLECPHLLAP